ncbi:MAG: 50S ribosomal protein L24 [Caldilineaceae bacterium]|jgi:large subunit ribosomal protein L24|nr:50S ribosomal protein L24 [Caldilineaceae bacterium]
MNVKISKGDTVEVIAGNDKGHRGEVHEVIRKKNKDGSYDPNRVYVIVAGANLVIKHQRRTPNVRTQAGRIEKEAPIHISNVMLVGTDGRPTRAGYEVAANGEKSRIDRRTGDPLARNK